MRTDWKEIIPRLERLIDRADALLSHAARTNGAHTESLSDLFDGYIAFWWRNQHLSPVKHPDLVDIADLIGIDRQIEELDRNTRQFINGLKANHSLLWGDRGTGKSSLIKGIFHRYAEDGLRLIEVNKGSLLHLQEITDLVWDRAERYILFCDDLSFSEEEPEYRELKAMLEGGISARPENVLIYATSNRRHLMPRQVRENQFPRSDEDELYPRESTEEKVSLSDRFGLRMAFYRISQDTYLQMVSHYAQKEGLSIPIKELHPIALEWEAASSGRSGRVARQFIDDLAGRLGLENDGNL
ncbi:ATP-binding protein [Candidatus Poribacteria bacterium]|nr:ATP-binding protein [Candidatus Poribacteria bacterium]